MGRASTDLNLTSQNIYVGEDETIIVELPDDATGNVTIIIDGEKYIANVKEGKATFNVKGLKAGEYDIVAIYDGDNEYLPANSTARFKVSKYSSNVDVTAPDIKVTEEGKVVVSVPKDATGTVTITVNGKHYIAAVKDGMATFEINDLKAGKYTIVAEYSGDDYYSGSVGDGHFKVTKFKPEVDVNAPEVKVTEDGKVVVFLPKDATGTVTIEIDGKKYTAAVKDGKAVFYIPNLNLGDHSIKVTYSGDDKYSSISTDSDIVVVDDKNGTHENQYQKEESSSKGIDLSNYPTGNPILILLLILMTVGTTQIGRYRKK